MKQQGEPMPVETIAIPIVASKKLVEGVVADLYDLAKSAAGFQLKKWKAANHAETISKHIRQLRMVRTILQTEREIDLAKFYCPSEAHKKRADAACSKFCKALQKELREAEDYVAQIEGMKTVFQF
jgi:exonuclease III